MALSLCPSAPASVEDLSALAQNLAAAHGASLCYLSCFGSSLYGTRTLSSDMDLRGLFVAPGPGPLHLHLSTAPNAQRNGSGDVDLDLWDARHWLRTLLGRGDVGAVDLLYSFTHERCIFHCHPALESLFQAPQRLLSRRLLATAGAYALGQAKKYGIKGSRLGLLRRLRQILSGLPARDRLGQHIPQLCACVGPDPHLRQRDGDLLVGGKIYQGNIRLGEMKTRLDRELSGYGYGDGQEPQTVDFKALSHAVRAIRQMEELLTTGAISFPLACREELLAIKGGTLPYSEVEQIILHGVQKFASTPPETIPGQWDEPYVRRWVDALDQMAYSTAFASG